MTKRLLLLTTAMGLILGTAAIAQNSAEPAKTDANKPAAQQTDKNAKPMSRVEKWQADKQTEAAEKAIDKNGAATPAKPTTNAQTPAAAPSTSANAQSQTPASNTGTSAQSQAPASGAAPTTNAQTPAANNGNAANQAQNNPPSTANKTLPNAGAQNQQSQTNPQAQPNAAPAQAQTPNAAPAANQQAQQPATNTTAASSDMANSAQTTLSAGVSVTDPQRTRISESVAKLNVQPLTRVNFSVSVGTVIPRDVRLHPVPAEVVEIVPQYRDYRFFTVREEIVIVEPSTMKIVTVLPRNGGSTASTTTSTQTSSTTTQRKSTISDNDRATIKKHASQPRRERTTSTTVERDDARSARAESRRSLRVGDRLPNSVELHDMPEPAYRDAPTLREYRYISRGSRTYVVEPRERTIIEEID
jgi:hypothetical protein